MYIAPDPCIDYQYLSLGRIQISPLVFSHTMHSSFKYDSTLLGHASFLQLGCLCIPYNYSKANFDGLDACIHNSNILNRLASQDVELVWSIISSMIFNAMDLFIPKFCLPSHQYPKWFSAELKC